MKSEYADRETLGDLLLKTKKAHETSDPVEVGDLGNSMGKAYMKELFSVINNHLKLIDKYYIQVIRVNEICGGRRSLSLRFAARRTDPGMEPAVDLWYVNNKKSEYRLLWTLPPYENMDEILKYPSQFHEDVVFWVNFYKKAESANRRKTLQAKSKHKKRKEAKKKKSSLVSVS